MKIVQLTDAEIDFVAGGVGVKAEPGGVKGGVGGTLTAGGGSDNGNSGSGTDWNRKTDTLVASNNIGSGGSNGAFSGDGNDAAGGAAGQSPDRYAVKKK